MDARNIKATHDSLSESQELFLRFVDGDYTVTILSQDNLELGWGNDITITNRQVWIDAGKICFMKIRKQGDDL